MITPLAWVIQGFILSLRLVSVQSITLQKKSNHMDQAILIFHFLFNINNLWLSSYCFIKHQIIWKTKGSDFFGYEHEYH